MAFTAHFLLAALPWRVMETSTELPRTSQCLPGRLFGRREVLLQALKRRSNTMSSWDALEHRLAVGSEGCIVSASDGSVESSFRSIGRREYRLEYFRHPMRHRAP